MVDGAAEGIRVKLMKDITGERRLCFWLADLLGATSEAGAEGSNISLVDALGAASRIARLIFWSIEETERAVAVGE